MNLRFRLSAVTAGLVAWPLFTPASAAIIDIKGSAKVSIQEIKVDSGGSTSNGDFDDASDSFPDTSDTLPLQVVARLIAAGEAEAAAVAGAQFADPRDLNQPNPEEFAINLALSSVTSDTSYDVAAKLEEIRDLRFDVGELGLLPAGTPFDLTGTLFLDGALSIFASEAGRDLSGARVALLVTVVREAAGQDSQTVFSGTVELLGAAGGSVQVATEGTFPVSTLILSDLATVAPEFGELQVLILPRLQIDYQYPIAVGEDFTLRATVEVQAENVPGQVGVAAVIGSPVDSIEEVITLTDDSSSAKSFIDTLAKERENPSGGLAFQPSDPLAGLCPLTGLSGLIGAGLLTVMTRRR
ncbi:hypothetical protein RAS1_33100 [Phycisphaerae bacterium RAS1]|nr:hypothetical protein RAS1_33100 [Phycisphaerae bacterium RAS1]